MTLRAAIVVAAVLLAPRSAGADTAVSAEGDYALDAIERTIPASGKLPCAKNTVLYRGTHVRYFKPIRVNPAFIPHLERFEEILVEVAREHYGRPPRRLRHIGSFNCRRIRKLPELLSEHALGNALDVEGFVFGPAPRTERANLPRRLRRRFSVTVERDWHARGRRAVHAAFLRDLTDRLVKEDVFRVLLGPAWPGHHNHFHFDMAPYRLVAL